MRPAAQRKPSESEMPAAPHIAETRRLIAEMIDRVGIAIEDYSAAVKRLVALKIISFDAKFFNVHSDRDILPLKLFIADLEQALATFSNDRCDDVGDGSGPYSIEGIAFSALVQLVRIENAALAWGWTPKDLDAPSLDVQCGEDSQASRCAWRELKSCSRPSSDDLRV